jgi:hypothetical protein
MDILTIRASFVAERELNASFAELAHQLLCRLRRVDDFAKEAHFASISFGTATAMVSLCTSRPRYLLNCLMTCHLNGGSAPVVEQTPSLIRVA